MLKKLAIAALACAATPAVAVTPISTLFDNPHIDSTSPYSNCSFECINQYIGGQSFTLTAGATIDSFSFDFLSEAPTGAFTDTTVNWAVTSIVAGLPGAAIASGTTPLDQYVSGWNPRTYTGYVGTIDVVDFALGAGDWLLTMRVEDPTEDFFVYWAQGSGNGFAVGSNNDGASWFATYAGFDDMSLTVEGVASDVPLPAPALLLGAGLLGLGAASRRKRA